MFGLDDIARVQDAESRSITAENPDGEKGAGGQAASNLGPGRKGNPRLDDVPSGATETIADIEGPGAITHVWVTLPAETEAGGTVLRDVVLRCYWDGEDEPSVEVPIGDFFCCGHGRRARVESLPVVAAPDGGLNCYFPMPFRERARLTVENQHPGPLPSLYYQVDYELRTVPDDAAYLHAQWRRTDPNERGQDHVIVDGVEGRGHYVGTYLAWTSLERGWWGEGEVKFYLDGDDEYPTICGTGTEDYVGGAWGFGDDETYSTPFLGYPLYDAGDGRHGGPSHHGLYRWHVPDPVRFREDLRATVQAIAPGYWERRDDVASVAYWYQREPHAVFPALPGRDDRRPR